MDMDVDHIFTICDVGAKCKSKSEFYNVLVAEGWLTYLRLNSEVLMPTHDGKEKGSP